MFFSYLEMQGNFFWKHRTNSHLFVAKILQINKAFYVAGCWHLCSSFNITCHDWKKYNQSQLGKEKSTLL